MKYIMGVIILLGLAPTITLANCIAGGVPNIYLPSQIVTPSEKGSAGTVLYRYETLVPRITYTCGNRENTSWFSSFSRPEMGKTSIPDVYTTGIAGIGIRLKWPVSRSANSWVPGTFSCMGNCIEPADKMLIEIVQTGNTSSGTLPAGPLASVSFSADSSPLDRKLLMNIYLGELTVNVRSCSIVASNNNIDLGDYSLADIKKTSFTAAKKDFSITLDCPSSSSAKIRFDGARAWGQSMGVLKTSDNEANSARNAFVKLYTKNSVTSRYSELELGADIVFDRSSSFTGTRTANYSAEMYFSDALRDQVTAGNVSASVVYTLTIN